MKVKVIKKFIDKHTKKVHKVGDILNIKKERFEEIKKVDKNLVEEIAEKAPDTKTDENSAKKDTE